MSALARGLEQTSPDYALLQGVANASKHKQVTRRQPLVAEASDIGEVTAIVLYSDEDGDYSHSQSMIRVRCTDGVTRWLDPAITRVLNYWGNLLKDAGVCGYSARPEPQQAGERHLTRSEASTKLNLEALRGLDFRQTMQLLRFDNALGRAVPVDLTGADVQMRIYEPPQHVVDVTLSHPQHGQLTTAISLTDDENSEFHQLETQAEKDAFMERLLRTYRTEIERKFQDQLSGPARADDTDEQRPAQ